MHTRCQVTRRSFASKNYFYGWFPADMLAMAPAWIEYGVLRTGGEEIADYHTGEWLRNRGPPNAGRTIRS